MCNVTPYKKNFPQHRYSIASKNNKEIYLSEAGAKRRYYSRE